ncbi:type II toxin-antitoxin system PemK/MazF family toxin [Clostridium saudiense]|uniref:type II toxin-antitoxin system PemK/MazF family toxin n=1 Tax=Clostridium saudiense TaxID=1414720 RepID=UPI0018AA6E24|nr:type II toxin-antitoxin system PemK/MazF family toxin [Clostridium saudiense]
MVIRRGEIFRVDLGGAIGSVQAGIRPVLIIQNNTGNKYSPTCIGIPITSKENKRSLPTHKILKGYNFLLNTSTALAEQILTFNKNQILDYIGEINNNDLLEINQKIAISLAL